jgi:hypothetical protein
VSSLSGSCCADCQGDSQNVKWKHTAWLLFQPEERVRKRQRVEEPGGKDKPVVGHLAAVAHAIVGWPQGTRQPRSPALPQVVSGADAA